MKDSRIKEKFSKVMEIAEKVFEEKDERDIINSAIDNAQILKNLKKDIEKLIEEKNTDSAELKKMISNINKVTTKIFTEILHINLDIDKETK